VQISWLGSTTWTLFVIALIQVWKFFGVHMLVYIAALNAVPTELTEAARVEGAGFWTTLWRVRLPLIAPAFTFNVTLTLIGALSTFDLVLATTKGGPGSSSEVMNMLVFEKYGTGAFGFATAISFLLFLVILVAAIPLIAYLRRREVEL
jgi:raffinose/stachyose/melibiose transport system permease protein